MKLGREHFGLRNVSQKETVPATPSSPEQVAGMEALYRSIVDRSFKDLINAHAQGVSTREGKADNVTRKRLEDLAADKGMDMATLDAMIEWLADNTDKVE